MATISLTNGDLGGEVDFPNGMFSEPPPVKRAFENKSDLAQEMVSSSLSTTIFRDELLGKVPIYAIWLRKFDKNEQIAEQEWRKFRIDAVEQFDSFNERLQEIEDEFNAHKDIDDFLDITSMLDKKENTDHLCGKIEECEDTFDQVTGIFEKLSQYLSKADHRMKVDTMSANLRERYFSLLQQLNKRKELFRWVVPRLQKYKSSGSEIKMWLKTAESRSETLTSDAMSSMQKELIVDKIVEELSEKKDIYGIFSFSGRGLLTIDHELNNVFNVHLDTLQKDMHGISVRWEALCLDIETNFNELAREKKTKIDIKLKDETKHCKCCTPYKITKVGDGLYTFGTSKTNRLVRSHGTSIVVRVGGGWEYVYNFLMKVDPCRAKDFAPGNPNNKIDSIHCDNGVTLVPLNKDDSFSVQRLRRSTLMDPERKSRSAHRSDAIDELDSSEEAFDSINLSSSSSASSPTPGETQSKNSSKIGGFAKSRPSTPTRSSFSGPREKQSKNKLSTPTRSSSLGRNPHGTQSESRSKSDGLSKSRPSTPTPTSRETQSNSKPTGIPKSRPSTPTPTSRETQSKSKPTGIPKSRPSTPTQSSSVPSDSRVTQLKSKPTPDVSSTNRPSTRSRRSSSAEPGPRATTGGGLPRSRPSSPSSVPRRIPSRSRSTIALSNALSNNRPTTPNTRSSLVPSRETKSKSGSTIDGLPKNRPSTPTESSSAESALRENRSKSIPTIDGLARSRPSTQPPAASSAPVGRKLQRSSTVGGLPKNRPATPTRSSLVESGPRDTKLKSKPSFDSSSKNPPVKPTQPFVF